MRVLLSVLREFADLPNDAEAVATALNSLGMAVETTEEVGVPVAGVVTARIVRTERHPDADKVTRCFVDSGDGREMHVWCGATNMGAGDVVPLATIGTTMPDGRAIARRGILGIDSEGMLCSPVELGISAEASGLLILPHDTPLGIDPFVALGIQHDVVFDLDLTRNRPECWGHAGIARDLAAHFKVAYNGPRLKKITRGESRSISVTLSDVDRCPMFSATALSGVVVSSSPNWVKSRLSHLGMRSINNVVDASNLVMLELNQPNHAYDHASVSSFDVRRAHAGETLRTLDDVERALSEDDLLIVNATNGSPVGLAGIMGGLDSEVTDDTTTISLEMAWFTPDPIRFTVNRHGLRSEASTRFERGVDPDGVVLAAERFATILSETCPDLVLHDGMTIERDASCPSARNITLRPSQIQRTLGITMAIDEVARLLSPIGFTVGASGDDFLVTTPTFRPDCEEEIDIIEEIARHFGYDALGKSVPSSTVHGRLSHVQQRRRDVRRLMVALGLDEAMPSPFLAPGELSSAGLQEEQILRLANPLVAEESVLRTSLRPGLLKALVYNRSHRAPRIALWEIGHVYPPSADVSTQPLPREHEQLCIVVADADLDTSLRQWNALCERLGVGAQLDQARVPDGFHPTRSATIARGKQTIGAVGEISPVVLAALGIEGRVSCLEVDLSTLLRESPKPVQARDINRFPSSDIDLAFTMPDDVPAANLQRALRQAAGASLVFVELFDIYRGPGLEDGSRSLAFRLRLQKQGGTLTDSEISDIRDKCVAAAHKAGATLR
ncbi:MAG: phenylalanine--tRNA ligase subunit beta [Actinobacteria bacterium]|nr:phenylalanine--tRNA ligase subunit beta [Actinomycetota bacterium]